MFFIVLENDYIQTSSCSFYLFIIPFKYGNMKHFSNSSFYFLTSFFLLMIFCTTLFGLAFFQTHLLDVQVQFLCILCIICLLFLLFLLLFSDDDVMQN